MTEKAISALRQRLIDDMTIRRLSPKTKQHYIRHVKNFADFIGRSPDKAEPRGDSAGTCPEWSLCDVNV